jgi:hypothetical protein
MLPWQSPGLPQREKRPQGLAFLRFTRSVISTPWFARCLSSQVFAPLSSSYFSLCPWVLLNVAWPPWALSFPMGFTPIAFTSCLLTTTWPPGIALFPVSSPPKAFLLGLLSRALKIHDFASLALTHQDFHDYRPDHPGLTPWRFPRKSTTWGFPRFASITGALRPRSLPNIAPSGRSPFGALCFQGLIPWHWHNLGLPRNSICRHLSASSFSRDGATSIRDKTNNSCHIAWERLVEFSLNLEWNLCHCVLFHICT